MRESVGWKGAVTLDQYVMRLIREKKTQTEEFQVLIRVFGREKLIEIWEKMKAMEGQNEHENGNRISN